MVSYVQLLLAKLSLNELHIASCELKLSSIRSSTILEALSVPTIPTITTSAQHRSDSIVKKTTASARRIWCRLIQSPFLVALAETTLGIRAFWYAIEYHGFKFKDQTMVTTPNILLKGHNPCLI